MPDDEVFESGKGRAPRRPGRSVPPGAVTSVPPGAVTKVSSNCYPQVTSSG